MFTRGCHAVKLFAKHIKVEEQVRLASHCKFSVASSHCIFLVIPYTENWCIHLVC
jgi:hypothetical protein